LILFSSELELDIKTNIIMTKLILDAARDKIFLMIIDDNNNYNISYENSKTNYEKLILLINEFLVSKNLNLKKISEIYVNRGPGSFAGIRNSLSVVKAIHLANKINYFCFSFKDFNGQNEVKYELIPQLCEKFKVKKNLINPIYMS
jgi:tRNA threonylcarbamoyladenosine biosynthesis protein TsaB